MGLANSRAHLSSSIDQIPNKYNTPTKITLENQDAILGIVNNNGDIIVNEDGVYFIIVSAQVAQVKKHINIIDTWKRVNINKCKSMNKPIYIDMWLTINEVTVPNSGARISVTDKNDVDIIMFQRIAKLTIGDRLNIYMSVVTDHECDFECANNVIGLVAYVPHDIRESTIPSVSVSINEFSVL